MGTYHEALQRWQSTNFQNRQEILTRNVFEHDFTFPQELANDFVRIQEQIEYAQPADNPLINRRAKMIAVAGVTPQAGTTALAYYLAMLYAYGVGRMENSAGPKNDRTNATGPRPSIKPLHKVLLIDANLHGPRLHDFFNLYPEVGLTEMVEDNLPFNEVLKFTPSGTLALLTAGRPARSRPGVFRSLMFMELLRYASREFTHVIFDFAPVSVHPDVLVVVGALDGALLSLRTGYTAVADLQRAKASLESHQIPILGVVMNGR
jgi:Mrp family chromosome partitioning ATPase